MASGKDMRFTSLVVSGGAMKGISVIGCMQYLEEEGILEGIRNFVGTSAGAIVCLFMVLGYRTQELRRFVVENLNDDNIRSFDVEQAFDILSSYGLSDGKSLEELFRRALYKKLRVRDITFLELAKASAKNLVVCATNLTQEREEFFSVDTTPNTSVILAIRASTSLPFLFQPVQINEDMYVDGAMYNNFPIDYVKDTKLRDILGIHIAPSKITITNILTFFVYILTSILNRANKKQNDENLNIVTIDIEDTEWFSLETMQLKVTAETVDSYIASGYRSIKEQLSTLRAPAASP